MAHGCSTALHHFRGGRWIVLEFKRALTANLHPDIAPKLFPGFGGLVDVHAHKQPRLMPNIQIKQI